MRVFTYSEARQNLASLLDLARSEDVEIRRKDGSRFLLRAQSPDQRSSLDVPGVENNVTTAEICSVLRGVRGRA